MQCPACHAQVADDQTFCGRCGHRIDAHDVTATSDATMRRPVAPARPAAAGAKGWLSSSGAISHGRFQPGEVVGDRYRVIGLLGRGGMGEVYRADDLRLGQQVALKFLPEDLTQNPRRLAQFHGEVRTAREVTHPNVCRVYDIGDVGGHLYISMEYVDGEDLAASLRRVGRFPEEKAVALARQICGGLAAAHERGIVHRDLKPANIMLDGSGRVRLMDFGLAAVGEIEDVRSGTPAYMAPEQIEGTEVTQRSDIYALGLVLYELFTGRRAFTAATMADLVLQQMSGDVTAPSEIVKHLDPAIERAILRCLDREPARRPASALSVAAALPGGDPLAAALAAGETPSPAMVAAAGGVEQAALSPLKGLLWLSAVAGALALLGALGSRVNLLARVPLEKPRPVLVDKAQELAARFGYTEPPADTASGYRYDQDYLKWATDQGEGKTRWAQLATGRPAVVRFWYRSSPRALVPLDTLHGITMGSEPDPPFSASGMVGLELDGQERLLSFRGEPLQVAEAGTARPFDWAALFDAAGLELSRFADRDPTLTPPAYADERRAWQGTVPELPHTTLMVDAAVYRGRLVMFEMVAPWTRPTRQDRRPEERHIDLIAGLILWGSFGAAALLARRHLRAGRGDRSAARRLAAFFVAGSLVLWLLDGSHVNDAGAELRRMYSSTADALFGGALAYLLYLALEPFVRRHWPQALITWSRFVSGRVTDPLVGRDLLIGTAVGLGLELLLRMPWVVSWWRDHEPQPGQANLSALLGWRDVVADLASSALGAPLMAMILMLFLTLVRRVARKDWMTSALIAGPVGIAIAWGALSSAKSPTGWHVAWIVLAGAVTVALLIAIVMTIIRLGLFLFGVILLVMRTTDNFPLTLDPSTLAARPTWLAAAVIVALGIIGFRLARGREPLFGASTHD